MIPDPLAGPYLILCEGGNDYAFFKALLRIRNIPDFQIAFPEYPDQHSDGRNGIGTLLGGLIVKDGFSNLQGIIVTSDNDDDQNASFRLIQDQIRQAGKYNVPARPFEVTKIKDLPSLIVLMLPWNDEPGNLETLCLRSACDKWPQLAACLEVYCQCSDVPTWTLTKQSKMRLRCLITATCKQDPNTSLSHIWERQEQFHIPLDHQCFDNIAKFLKNFATQ